MSTARPAISQRWLQQRLALAGRDRAERGKRDREQDAGVVVEWKAPDPGHREPPDPTALEAAHRVGRVEHEPEVVPDDREQEVGRERGQLAGERPVDPHRERQVQDHERDREREHVVAGQRAVAHHDAVDPPDAPALQEPGRQPLGPAVAALDLDLDRGEAECPQPEQQDAADLEVLHRSYSPRISFALL